MATYVLVHGICHGAWCWELTIDDLSDLGHSVIAVDLALETLDGDAEIVENVLDAIDEPVVLVGHSYGGAVISKAAAGRTDVDHLVYVAAIMLDGSTALTEQLANFPLPDTGQSIAISAEGIVTVSPEAARALFYNTCTQEASDAASAQLRPTAFAVLATPTGAEPWHDIVSTYVVCDQDNAIHPDLQRAMAANAKQVITIDTDHSPFMSATDAFRDALLTTLT